MPTEVVVIMMKGIKYTHLLLRWIALFPWVHLPPASPMTTPTTITIIITMTKNALLACPTSAGTFSPPSTRRRPLPPSPTATPTPPPLAATLFWLAAVLIATPLPLPSGGTVLEAQR